MTRMQATAQVFWTAFRALPRKEQLDILRRALQDKQLRQALLDLTAQPKRRTERLPVRHALTARDLLNSDLIGMWQNRADIRDSAAFARQLREQAQNREYQ